MWAIPSLYYFIFVFSTINRVFEHGSSGIGSDRSANSATTSDNFYVKLQLQLFTTI